MRYTVNGLIIRSENAAKPPSQASRYIVRLLNELGPFSHALDYGCGRLRYAAHLYRLSKRLAVVDSADQIDRNQTVFGKTRTVREYVAGNWKRARAYSLADFRNRSQKYSFILCTNVLSSIPACRVRHAVLRTLALRLTRNGVLLITCQYSNSSFSAHLRDAAVMKYNDGFLLGTDQRMSFYGIISLPKLVAYVTRAGLTVDRAWRGNQTAYVVASHGRHRRIRG